MGKRKNIARTSREAEAQTRLAERAEVARRVHLTPEQRAAEDEALEAYEVERSRQYLTSLAVAVAVVGGVVVWALFGGFVALAAVVAWAVLAYRFLRRPAEQPERPEPIDPVAEREFAVEHGLPTGVWDASPNMPPSPADSGPRGRHARPGDDTGLRSAP